MWTTTYTATTDQPPAAVGPRCAPCTPATRPRPPATGSSCTPVRRGHPNLDDPGRPGHRRVGHHRRAGRAALRGPHRPGRRRAGLPDRAEPRRCWHPRRPHPGDRCPPAPTRPVRSSARRSAPTSRSRPPSCSPPRPPGAVSRAATRRAATSTRAGAPTPGCPARAAPEGPAARWHADPMAGALSTSFDQAEHSPGLQLWRVTALWQSRDAAGARPARPHPCAVRAAQRRSSGSTPTGR